MAKKKKKEKEEFEEALYMLLVILSDEQATRKLVQKITEVGTAYAKSLQALQGKDTSKTN